MERLFDLDIFRILRVFILIFNVKRKKKEKRIRYFIYEYEDIELGNLNTNRERQVNRWRYEIYKIRRKKANKKEKR